jgi:hypothetical protein
MSGFSRIVLDHSVRLALEAIPPERDPRVAECARDIRRYIRWMADEGSVLDYRDHLRDAVSELSAIALMHRELSIASRLQDVAEQLTVQRLLAINGSRTEKGKGPFSGYCSGDASA